MQTIGDIESVVCETWSKGRQQAPVTWMGPFTHNEVFTTVRGCTTNTTLFYKVGEGGRLHRIWVESKPAARYVFQCVRVFGVCDRIWHIDPDPNSISGDPKWQLLVLGVTSFGTTTMEFKKVAMVEPLGPCRETSHTIVSVRNLP